MCAVLDDDSLKCWGYNEDGQLGVNDQTDRYVPTAVDLGTGRTAKSVSVGGHHTCAVLDDDTVKCWGYNNNGELGVGDSTNRLVPTAVDLGTGRTAKSVSAGSGHTCAVLDDDSLKCWGSNSYGQLGVGDQTNRNTPTAVDLGTGRTAVSLLERLTRAQCLTMTLLSAGDTMVMVGLGWVTRQTDTSQLRLISSQVARPRVSLSEPFTRAQC